MHKVVGRKEALERGLRFYFTGRPCVRGHVDYRLTSCRQCRQCWKDNAKRWRDANPERSKKSDARLRALLAARAWRQANPEKYRAIKVRYRERHGHW